jgi:hypothetical protein
MLNICDMVLENLIENDIDIVYNHNLRAIIQLRSYGYCLAINRLNECHIAVDVI